MNPPPAALSIYLHIPFCLHRCAYCDFHTYAGKEASIPAYVESLKREIHFIGRQLDHETRYSDLQTIGTIFFGGGTPSLLSGAQLTSVMEALRTAFPLAPDLEATLEANPGTTSPEFLDQIRTAGINRLSFGVQSANPDELQQLERVHDFFDVIRSIQWARQAGFDNLNLDIIYGLPEQSLSAWQTTVKRIVDLHPEHISAYALTIEAGTSFGRWADRGLMPTPDPDLAADMYEWASNFLEAHGYVQYEISNWARGVPSHKIKVNAPLPSPDAVQDERSTFDLPPEWACKHNLQYWRSRPYLGLGAGAHGYANGLRYSNVLRIHTYIERLAASNQPLPTNFPLTPACVHHHKQTLCDDMSEYMLNHLRLTGTGVLESDFQSRFGSRLSEVYPSEIEELIRLGLLERVLCGNPNDASSDPPYAIRLTHSARLVANQVFIRFVG